MNDKSNVPAVPQIYCPLKDDRVPIWYCLGSLTQNTEKCEYLIRAKIIGMKAATVECQIMQTVIA